MLQCKPYIKSVKIDRYRSFNTVNIETNWLNIYSGTNNVGKSNILKALDLFFNFKERPFNYDRDYNKAYTESAGGKRLVKIEITFNGRGEGALKDDFSVIREFYYNNDTPDTIFKSTNNKIQQQIDKRDGNTLRQFNLFLNKIKYYYIPAVRSREFVINFLNNFNDIIAADAVSNEAFNACQNKMSKILAEKSKNLSDSFRDFIGLPAEATISSNKINIGVNVYSGIRVKAKGKNKKNKFIQKTIDLFSSGDGILMSYVAYFLSYLCQMQTYKYFIWGFEEPENSLEYSKVQRLAKEFYESFISVAQIFITTHSPAFIKLKENDEVAFYRVYKDPENKDKQITLVETLDDIRRKQELLFKSEQMDHIESLEKEIGMVEFAQEIEKSMMEYIKAKNEIKDENKRLKNKIDKIKRSIYIITEGKTDVAHLKLAMTKLRIDMKNIEFAKIDEPFGEQQLHKFLEFSKLKKREGKIIGIFDRDVRATVAKIEEGGRAYKNFGNNVFAFCIPPLAGRDSIAIEHYYGDFAKTPDADGRRLFFGSEFSRGKEMFKGNIMDNAGQFIAAKPKADKIAQDAIIEDVYTLDNKSVSLSKDAFATKVAPALADFDWEAFRPIIDKIQKIIDLK